MVYGIFKVINNNIEVLFFAGHNYGYLMEFNEKIYEIVKQYNSEGVKFKEETLYFYEEDMELMEMTEEKVDWTNSVVKYNGKIYTLYCLD